jgi:hypothetical protein
VDGGVFCFAPCKKADNPLTTGDLNGDGNLDVATANTESNNVSVLLGNGMGGFAAAVNFPIHK